MQPNLRLKDESVCNIRVGEKPLTFIKAHVILKIKVFDCLLGHLGLLHYHILTVKKWRVLSCQNKDWVKAMEFKYEVVISSSPQ